MCTVSCFYDNLGLYYEDPCFTYCFCVVNESRFYLLFYLLFLCCKGFLVTLVLFNSYDLWVWFLKKKKKMKVGFNHTQKTINHKCHKLIQHSNVINYNFVIKIKKRKNIVIKTQMDRDG